VLLARFAFQACSIDHSDISPLLESTVCEQSTKVTARSTDFLVFFDYLWIQRLTRKDGADRASASSLMRLRWLLCAQRRLGQTKACVLTG
jgi:hypothetical protein